MESRRTVNVYVDGFSLYHALLKRKYPQHKWLDLRKLCELLFPERHVAQVKYFTAAVKPLRGDQGIGQRQQVYWEALRESRVEIIEGKFIFTKPFYPIHPERFDTSGNVQTVQVKRPEEKGTDVALATHLLLDALECRSETFAILTNDSDLVEPVRALSVRGFDVSLISVMGDEYNKAFGDDIISSIHKVREGSLAASQLADVIRTSAGRTIRKPTRWQ